MDGHPVHCVLRCCPLPDGETMNLLLRITLAIVPKTGQNTLRNMLIIMRVILALIMLICASCFFAFTAYGFDHHNLTDILIGLGFLVVLVDLIFNRYK